MFLIDSVSNDDFKINALLVWKKNDEKVRQHHNYDLCHGSVQGHTFIQCDFLQSNQ